MAGNKFARHHFRRWYVSKIVWLSIIHHFTKNVPKKLRNDQQTAHIFAVATISYFYYLSIYKTTLPWRPRVQATEHTAFSKTLERWTHPRRLTWVATAKWTPSETAIFSSRWQEQLRKSGPSAPMTQHGLRLDRCKCSNGRMSSLDGI